MNDERIQQVMSIEKEASQIHDVALRDSQQILTLASQEVDTIIEKSKKEAALESQKLVAEVPVEEESTRILKEAEERIARDLNLSKGNLERAVNYVIDHTIGKE